MVGLDDLLDALLPERKVAPAQDPLNVAWNLAAYHIEPSKEQLAYYANCHPGKTPVGRLSAVSSNERLLLVAVATLQVAGELPTPRTVGQLIRNVPQTASKKLRFLSGSSGRWWWKVDPPVLSRNKHGRTYYYTINEGVGQ